VGYGQEVSILYELYNCENIISVSEVFLTQLFVKKYEFIWGLKYVTSPAGHLDTILGIIFCILY
jgi:hypothetical protein